MPAIRRPQTYALNSAGTEIGEVECTLEIITSDTENAESQVGNFQFHTNNTDLLTFVLRLNMSSLLQNHSEGKEYYSTVKI
jgi:hypothetical protein